MQEKKVDVKKELDWKARARVGCLHMKTRALLSTVPAARRRDPPVPKQLNCTLPSEHCGVQILLMGRLFLFYFVFPTTGFSFSLCKIMGYFQEQLTGKIPLLPPRVVRGTPWLRARASSPGHSLSSGSLGLRPCWMSPGLAEGVTRGKRGPASSSSG